MESIAVIMSTYNGEKYLREQIDSILNQKNVDVNLYIRDDGSSDNTIEIIRSYGKKVKYIKGENAGVGSSFMRLLHKIPLIYDYYAFSDQDDIWLDNKLEKAVSAIRDKEIPALYTSNQILVDKDGTVIGPRHEEKLNTSYEQIITDNVLTGCTMVWNKGLQELLAEKKRLPSSLLLKKRIHDVWVSLVASAVGEIVYDENGYINYRQHENNVVGVKHQSVIKTWTKKIKKSETRNGRSYICKELLKRYGDIIDNIDIINYCTEIANYKKSVFSRCKVAFNKRYTAYSSENQLSFAVKVFLGLV